MLAEPGRTPDMPSERALAMTAYSVVVYVWFLVVFAYLVGWVEGIAVPRTIDEGPTVSTATAMAVDLLLLGVFTMQHSVMARPAFKRVWTRVVPAPIERSTYVLLAAATLALLMWQWRPLPDVLWDTEPTVARTLVYILSFSGWALVLAATFMIDHLDLFGLRQVLRSRANKPPSEPAFVTPSLYRVVRHPLYLGFLLAFWAAPTMTQGRLLFASATSAYILIAVRLEERDLVATFGNQYRAYRNMTPRLLLLPRRVPNTSTNRRHRG
jgi:protein-S-isoprenylcysteine O-methyltransferase Ste14